MRQTIDAIAFDIDGTLYPNHRLYIRLIPFLIANASFMVHFGLVRKQIRLWQENHPGEKKEDFFLWQAQLFSKICGISVKKSQALIDKKIYKGWKPIFARIKPYRHVLESIVEFKKTGLKIGILSDFLPNQKDDIWGIAPLCDVVLGSEETGALKPSSIPFNVLASKLDVPVSRILYVGNSIKSDVQGASRAGMKTACIHSAFFSLLGKKIPGADISFYSYRKLQKIVLK